MLKPRLVQAALRKDWPMAGLCPVFGLHASPSDKALLRHIDELWGIPVHGSAHATVVDVASPTGC